MMETAMFYEMNELELNVINGGEVNIEIKTSDVLYLVSGALLATVCPAFAVGLVALNFVNNTILTPNIEY